MSDVENEVKEEAEKLEEEAKKLEAEAEKVGKEVVKDVETDIDKEHPNGKAIDNIGRHLLGRVAPPKDKRDFKLEDFLDEDADDLDGVLASLVKSTSVAVATKNFAKIVVEHIRKLEGNPVKPTPTPDPTPTPTPDPTPTGDVLWGDPDQLDQGQTPHCVGFGNAQFCNADPINDHYTNADGDKIYYEAKVIDGEPKAEDGSSVHSGMKALKNRGRVGTYAWSTSTADIATWVKTKGPVVVGADWYNDMFNPDTDGYVTPTGGIAGGHCFIIVGVLANGDFEFQNSWGAEWGLNGRFKMKSADFNKLVISDGFEAAAAVENAL